MKPADRKEAILQAAIQAAQQHGYTGFRLSHVADIAGCSNALVVSYFSTMTQVRRDVMRYAIKARLLRIIAAGVATGDKNCTRIPDALRREALAAVA